MVRQLKLIAEVTVKNVTKATKKKLLLGTDESKEYVFTEEYNLNDYSDDFYKTTLKLFEIV